MKRIKMTKYNIEDVLVYLAKSRETRAYYHISEIAEDKIHDKAWELNMILEITKESPFINKIVCSYLVDDLEYDN